MDKWELIPTKKIGEIEFGMDRQTVRNLFDMKVKEFRKSKFSKNTTDDFSKFHVFYSHDDRVEAVEVFEGIEVWLDGNKIYPSSVEDLEKCITGIAKEDDGYIQTELSIAIYAPCNKAESILVGCKGYYV